MIILFLKGLESIVGIKLKSYSGIFNRFYFLILFNFEKNIALFNTIKVPEKI